ncbi:unknown [Firmicutes bacterium CAG:137]|nr:unknown [Firmicutes bacterium CAG:137]
MPLAHNHRLRQGKANPTGGAPAAPLVAAASDDTVKEVIRLLATVLGGLALDAGVQRHIGSLVQGAQIGLLHTGGNIDFAVFVGDDHLHTLGHGGGTGQVGLVHPAFALQVGHRRAANGLEGLVAVAQQVQQLVLLAIALVDDVGHFLPHQSGLLAAVGEAHGGNLVAIHSKASVAIDFICIRDPNVLGSGSLRQCHCIVGGRIGHLSGYRIIGSVDRYFHGHLSQDFVAPIGIGV